MTRKPLLAVAVLVLGTVGGGCSFAFGEGPPTAHAQMPYFDCVSTYGLPVADGVLALSGVNGAIATFRKSKQEFADQNNGGNRNVAGGVNVAVAAAFGASAIYGIVQAERCGRAKRELEARILRPMLPLPRSGPPAAPIPFAPRPPPPPPPAPAPSGAEEPMVIPEAPPPVPQAPAP